jgi:hypothetical protein
VIQFVVTCAKAKRGRVPAGRRLSSIGKRQAHAAAGQWVARLRDVAEPTTPAAELYRGDHWKAATEAATTAVAAGGRAWVASAGYGLIPFDAPVSPYSATFTANDPDSVSRLRTTEGAMVQAVWWSAVAEWEGPSAGAPRLVADLAARYPNDLLVVTLSEPYLRALTPDLIVARERLSSPERLLVLCGGAPADHPLAENLVRWDTRAQLVPGALASMNARVARRLLQEMQPRRLSLAAAREHVAGWAKTAPARARPVRLRVSDDVVLAFIRDRLVSWPLPSPSALHREFRDSGFACERLRFLSLLRVTTEN